jgi:hypothetical protein
MTRRAAMISLADKRREKLEQETQREIDHLLLQKKIVAREIEGEIRYAVTAGAWCGDLCDDHLDAFCERELVYELESRGLLRLRKIDGVWLWRLTAKGQKSTLSSYDKALYEVCEGLGLKEVVDRKSQLIELSEQTGLFDY